MNKITKVILVSLPFILAIVFATTLLNSPSSCSGSWTNCSNAFADNNNRATASVNANLNKTGVWNNYGFSIANDSVIDNVTIRSDFFASKSNGYIDIKVSGNNGATFGLSHVVGGNTIEQTFLIDVTNDLIWTPDKFSNNNLKINVTCFKQGSGGNPTCNLDWIPVQVTFSTTTTSTTTSSSTINRISFNIWLNQIVNNNNATVYTNQTVNTTAYLSAGNTYFWMLIDGVLYQNSTSPLINFTNFVTDKLYNITFIYPGNATSAYNKTTYWYNVIATTTTSTTTQPATSSSSTTIPFDFSISVAPTNGTVTKGNNITTTTQAALLSGTSKQVNLTQTSCPSSSTCSFSPSFGNPTYYSNFTISTTNSTQTGNYLINITGTGDGKTRNAIYNLIVN